MYIYIYVHIQIYADIHTYITLLDIALHCITIQTDIHTHMHTYMFNNCFVTHTTEDITHSRMVRNTTFFEKEGGRRTI